MIAHYLKIALRDEWPVGLAFFAATGLILGAAYALWLYRQIVFGELTKEKDKYKQMASELDVTYADLAGY